MPETVPPATSTSIRSALFPRRILQWLGPLIVTGLLTLTAAAVVLSAGWLDLSASTPHPEGWASLLHAVFRRSVDHHSRDAMTPDDFGTSLQIAKGARYYGRVCVSCHGAPGFGQNPTAMSMRPRPQFLAHEVGGFTDRELFGIVKHGVKYSAMPSWPVQDRDDEVWSVVSFLRMLPKMTGPQFLALANGPREPAPSAPDAAADGASVARAYSLPNADEPPVSSYRYTAPAAGLAGVARDHTPVATCVACHGSDGAGTPDGAFPNIALLDRTYLRDTLKAFAAGTRHSAYMQTIAVELSDRQIDAVATWFAAQPKRRAPTAAVSPATLRLGETLATTGDPAREVTACSNCHGVEGASPKGFSAINGQYPYYLASQLRLYRAGIRGTEQGNPMPAVAHGLTDREIAALALYYASREPWAPRPVQLPAVAGR